MRWVWQETRDLLEQQVKTLEIQVGDSSDTRQLCEGHLIQGFTDTLWIGMHLQMLRALYTQANCSQIKSCPKGLIASLQQESEGFHAKFEFGGGLELNVPK